MVLCCHTILDLALLRVVGKVMRMMIMQRGVTRMATMLMVVNGFNVLVEVILVDEIDHVLIRSVFR